MDSKTAEMLAINLEQKRYYEIASGAQTSIANSASTNVWRRARRRALGVFDAVDRRSTINNLHRSWIGPMEGLRILELGVGQGSPFSIEFASKAKSYTAIDLSQTEIDVLASKLGDAGVKNPDLRVVDFLSTEFEDDGYDLIYALSVFHHFRHVGVFLERVEQKLAQGGRVITYDPAQVWLPARLLRAAYRPLQTDAAWEYPFTDASMREIELRFRVLACQGFMGKSKWAATVGAAMPSLGAKLAKRWHNTDVSEMTNTQALRSCLQVSYHLARR